MFPTEKEWMGALTLRHGVALQKKFSAATVAVCGLGGLGSHIAATLARAGVGRLVLVDFDKVELSNLHRQQYKAGQIGLSKTEALAENLLEMAPYVQIVTITERITEENYAQLLPGADIICEAFDDAHAKAMLANKILETMPDTFLVAASGMAGMASANAIQTKRITSRFYLCGDTVSDVEDAGGLVASRVMACAAHQAHMVLRILAGKYEV